MRTDRLEVAHIAAVVDILFRIDHLGVDTTVRNADAVVGIRDRLHVQNDYEAEIFPIAGIDIDRLFIVVRIDPAEGSRIIVIGIEDLIGLVDLTQIAEITVEGVVCRIIQ